MVPNHFLEQQCSFLQRKHVPEVTSRDLSQMSLHNSLHSDLVSSENEIQGDTLTSHLGTKIYDSVNF